MGIESFGNLQQKSIEKKINLGDYGGRVVIEDGKYKTAEGTSLSEKEGELYVSEGENDAGTRIMKTNEEIISSS